MHFHLFLCLYESFWKGFESDQRRLTFIAGYQMHLLVWRVVNKTLKFRLTFLILSISLGDDPGFQINLSVTSRKLIVNIIRNVRRNLSVLFTQKVLA